MGAIITKNAETVKRWCHNFFAKRRFAAAIKQNHNLLPFLELNPDICSALKTYACLNLNILSVEMMVEYLHHTILPEMVWKEMEEQNSLQSNNHAALWTYQALSGNSLYMAEAAWFHL